MINNQYGKTLAFFDAQDMALTRAEAENYSPSPQSSPVQGEEGKRIPSPLAGEGRVRGLYFLPGREELAAQKQPRYRITLGRLRKSKKYLALLRYFPYLRAVALSGSSALLNSTPDSDIDLFIITKKNRIWLTRVLVSAYFQLAGQRRHGEKIAGRFCLNHYVAENTKITEDRNLYTAVEYASLLPVVGSLEKFWEINLWIRDYLPQAQCEPVVPFFAFRFSVISKILETILDYTIGPAINHLLGIYQKHRIKKQDYILVTDDELSFHPGSHGQKVLAEYKARLL